MLSTKSLLKYLRRLLGVKSRVSAEDADREPLLRAYRLALTRFATLWQALPNRSISSVVWAVVSAPRP